MNYLIPLNGRIAIVDDNKDDAFKLMRLLSKKNIPYAFYNGRLENFPDNPENDIRILFLDLNLLGDGVYTRERIRSNLSSTIKSIISPNNFPYVLVLWSLQENKYTDLLDDLFKKDLRDRAPIAIKSFAKSDVISEDQDEQTLFEKLYEILKELPAYGYLMQWENFIHDSADQTIKDVFQDFHSHENWTENADFIMNMFAHSYLEKHFRDSTPEDKVKNSLLFLNDVYHDTLETTIINSTIENVVELPTNVDEGQVKLIRPKINKSILMAKHSASKKQPGSVITATEGNTACKKHSKRILAESILSEDLREQIINKYGDMKTKEAKDEYNSLLKKRRDLVNETLIPCGIVVTPACDYAQDKAVYDRIVLGIIIESRFKDYIDQKSEAIYISPSFDFNSKESIFVLNFRFFITDVLKNKVDLQSVFRIRSSVLSEIQSKLARHINRQGIMNL